MYWLIGIISIFVIAIIIIKLIVNTKDNPDSKLGILEHPSTFEKQNIEHVDYELGKANSKNVKIESANDES